MGRIKEFDDIIRGGKTMWREELDKIITEMGTYEEEVNSGISDEEFNAFVKKAKQEFNWDLPEDYTKILKDINGIEFNGFILYGVDEELLQGVPNQHINGFLENNEIWLENEWESQYMFLGESDMSWYVYDISTEKYYELDNPSGSVMEEFNGFEYMFEKMLSDAFM